MSPSFTMNMKRVTEIVTTSLRGFAIHCHFKFMVSTLNALPNTVQLFTLFWVFCLLLLLLLLRGSLASRVVLLNQSLDLGGRSADKLVGSLGVTVLEDVEGGHGLDVVLGSQLGVVVDVNLDKVDVGVLVGPPAREKRLILRSRRAR